MRPLALVVAFVALAACGGRTTLDEVNDPTDASMRTTGTTTGPGMGTSTGPASGTVTGGATDQTTEDAGTCAAVLPSNYDQARRRGRARRCRPHGRERVPRWHDGVSRVLGHAVRGRWKRLRPVPSDLRTAR